MSRELRFISADRHKESRRWFFATAIACAVVLGAAAGVLNSRAGF